MDYQLHGFIIGSDIHFDILKRRLYRLPSSIGDKNIIFGTVLFNDTMLHLFLYLLKNARDTPVTKDELLKKVWEDNNLCPSSQRLWQVLKNLNKKLVMMGLPTDFILNIKGCGYMINYDDVTPIYYKSKDIDDVP